MCAVDYALKRFLHFLSLPVTITLNLEPLEFRTQLLL